MLPTLALTRACGERVGRRVVNEAAVQVSGRRGAVRAPGTATDTGAAADSLAARANTRAARQSARPRWRPRSPQPPRFCPRQRVQPLQQPLTPPPGAGWPPCRVAHRRQLASGPDTASGLASPPAPADDGESRHARRLSARGGRVPTWAARLHERGDLDLDPHVGPGAIPQHALLELEVEPPWSQLARRVVESDTNTLLHHRDPPVHQDRHERENWRATQRSVSRAVGAHGAGAGHREK